MLERILVPLDGSPLAEGILAQLRPLLLRRDAEVMLLRVVPFPVSTRVYDTSLRAEAHLEAKRYLSDMEKLLADKGVRVRTASGEGAPAEEILDAAAREGATMIAMSTHGRSGIARWILGSVAEKVVRASKVPVLLMRSFAGAPAAPAPKEERALKKILVPLDGSETSMAVLPHVAELAKLYDATAMLLYVEETVFYPPGSFAGAMVGLPVVPPPEPETPRGGGESALKYAIDRLVSAGVRDVITLTSGGDPAVQILEFAARKMADAIAMATHGRTGLSRWVLGSVTEKVLRASPLPMLVVRAESTR
jgi:nucleotide-binding universal stress UspA family protein